MAGVYRNTGARWIRADGTVIERGAEFVPTEEERLRKAHKLTYLRSDSEGATNGVSSPNVSPEELDYFDQGNGWYLIGGEKIHGREAAAERLDAIKAEQQRERVAYRLDGP